DTGVCLLEAVAWWAGEDHSDQPDCVSVVLGTFGRNLNDVLPDGRRQELVRFVPLLPGTRGDGRDEDRSYLALDWLIRTYTPTWLELRPELADVAAELRSLRRIVDLTAAQAAGPIVRNAQEKARAAGAAAWAAARAAAWAAARDAARAAAGDAARDAAWDAAGDAARDAAGAAARDAARDAAWAAARDAARDAARAAARDAARDALQPTVDALQTSAIDLYAAMIRPAPHTGEEAA
ncbi:MAG TPA: hypothetical protein VFH74_13390, partial [Gaiellales bacterium]|nr:hypothetical protein [Gaiellales bacterium]